MAEKKIKELMEETIDALEAMYKESKIELQYRILFGTMGYLIYDDIVDKFEALMINNTKKLAIELKER